MASLGLALALPHLHNLRLSDDSTQGLQGVVDLFGAEEGEVYDVKAAFLRGAIWADVARTTPAVVDGPIASIQGELLRYYAEQATAAAQPTLRTDGNRYWMEGDGTKAITFVMATPLSDSHLAAGIRQLAAVPAPNILSNFTNDDVNGQSSLFLVSGSSLRYRIRIAGSLADAAVVGNILGVDATVGGRWSSAVGQATARLDGVDGSPLNTVKVGGNTSVSFMAQDAAGTNPSYNGRIYCGLIRGAFPTASELAAIDSWSKQRSGTA